MNEIVLKLQNNNRSNVKFTPIGIVVHETATPGAAAGDESRFFDKTSKKVSVHLFIDWDTVIQKIPFNEMAWHAGYTANKKYIGIELCRPQGHDEEKFISVWKRAVWCFAFVFINYIHAVHVSSENLLSHADCSRLWHETTHTDPEGYFSEYEKTVKDFRDEVQKEIDRQLGMDKQQQSESVELVVTANILNCRRGPGVEYQIMKKFRKGDYVTAIGITGEWWRLDVNGEYGYVYKKYTRIRQKK